MIPEFPAGKSAPVLIGLDWGTSSVRAFLMDAGGEVIDQRADAHGLQNLSEAGAAGFDRAFIGLCGEWLDRWPGLPVVAGGMIGSAQGWVEAPYVACPADIGLLAERASVAGSSTGTTIRIAPGVMFDPPGADPDVMRGEEIQISGALAEHPELAGRACIVLPGTHSKWAQVDGGRITRFATYMTGELFAVLCRHSILGRLMTKTPAGSGAEEADAAFAAGVRAAASSGPGDLPHQLFATRTLGLTRRMPHEVLGDYLSGLLIGHELVSGLAGLRGAVDVPLALVGEGALCRRYQHALAALGIPPAIQLGNTAPRGLFLLALASGMIVPTGETAA